MANAVFSIDNYQRELFPYAYNILGMAEDAKDVVQEVMINWHQLDHNLIENPRAYLIRSVVNRAINQKEKNNRKRHSYIGQWLPEPIYTDNTDSRLDSKNVLTYSMLVLLEQLNAKERAVFILRETFDYSHADITLALGITEDSSRQLYKRAKAKVGPATINPIKHQETIAQMDEFMRAVISGNATKVEQLLAQDVQFISDSNGKATAARNILQGMETIRKFMIGIFHKPASTEYEVEPAWINHQPALIWSLNGEVTRCTVFDIRDGKIEHIHFMLNPDKLSNLRKKENLSRP